MAKNKFVIENDYARFFIGNDKSFIVDVEDVYLVSQYAWNIDKRNRVKTKHKQSTVYLHRLVMTSPSNLQVDHINHDRTDNRQRNLRICTNKENNCNKVKRDGCSSQYKGVCWDKHNNKWKAKIYVDGRCINLGNYEDETEAAQGYNIAAIKYFKEFAYLNVV